MKFKAGDRVRVLRLNNSNVDFFTTLRYVNLPGLYQMIDSTDSNYNEHLLRKSNQRNFGPDKDDYYVLAEDEEDTGGNNMPTIKRKVEMNLPELIEWGWKNPEKVECKPFKSNRKDSFGKYAVIYFTNCGHGFYTHRVTDKDTFTVKVEEEITEDTEFELMIEIIDGYQNCLWERASIGDWKDEDSKEFHAYIDGEFKLIWRDGKLVE